MISWKILFFVRCKGYLFVLEELNRVSLFYQTQRFPIGCFVPLMILHLMKFTQPKENMDPLYLSDLKSCLNNAIKKYMHQPILENENSFLKAALLHPGVAKIVCSQVNQQLIHKTFKSIISDAVFIDADDSDCEAFVSISLKFYRETIIGDTIKLPVSLPWKDLTEKGSINGFGHLEFWKDVAGKGFQFHNGKCAHLKKVASMLLAQPAGESIDESTFSSVGVTMRKERSRLAPMKIEQITIIRMFIRNFKWDPYLLHKWFERQIESQN